MGHLLHQPTVPLRDITALLKRLGDGGNDHLVHRDARTACGVIKTFMELVW
jgi:hypothetical protein